VTRPPSARVTDILDAVRRCQTYRTHLDTSDPDLSQMAFEAILRNLAVIGEAVRSLPDDTTQAHPEIPWPAIIGLRNIVVHEYFAIRSELIVDIVDNHLTALADVLAPTGDEPSSPRS